MIKQTLLRHSKKERNLKLFDNSTRYLQYFTIPFLPNDKTKYL